MSTPAQQSEARALLEQLQNDLRHRSLSEEQLEDALAKLKVLGRDVGNVTAIYDEAGVGVLCAYAFGQYSSNIRLETLRCLANALLLLPQTRRSSINLGLDKTATDALQHASTDEEFLLSRILFLLTYDPQIDLSALIDEHSLADSIVKLLQRHAEALSESCGHTSNPAFPETLKLLFNVTNAKVEHISKFAPATAQLSRILKYTTIPSPPLQPPLSLIINALANLDFDSQSLETNPKAPAALTKLMTILEQAIQRYPTTELDTIAIPLLTVLRNINNKASPELRDQMKARLLPNDEERDQPLGKSSSLASQLLRLTTSAGLLNLSEAISGLMFELSDKDASQYVHNVGYGYAAGYLMTHKIPIPESARNGQYTGASSRQVPVNPVTGQRLDAEPVPDLPQMTDEEKEREAERLFVLFERLKATGVVDVKNPVEQARDEVRFEELSDSDSD
ncbi:guanine nucleotide exchange factor [Exophiala viscosa]|uniref:Guanine nucleotide exchange factor n=1 Tax=Exophiala viscosa TaxID=2486360 RepID=A0AAN6DYA2_9EURO|nr:guanine nucleotide exchange factor [Exophiala viscosa]